MLLHRESIIHSLVEFVDGSVKAQLGVPDMRLPIQCAMTYPDRLPCLDVPRLDLKTIGTLTFGIPTADRYPCLALALEAGRRGGTAPAAMAAADEIAVSHFITGHIGFSDIPRAIEDTVAADRHVSHPSLEEVLEADRRARAFTEDWVRAKA